MRPYETSSVRQAVPPNEHELLAISQRHAPTRPKACQTKAWRKSENKINKHTTTTTTTNNNDNNSNNKNDDNTNVILLAIMAIITILMMMIKLINVIILINNKENTDKNKYD